MIGTANQTMRMVLAAVIGMGCGGGGGGGNPDAHIAHMPDAPPGIDGSTIDSSMGGPPDASSGDNNDSFGQAVPLTVDDTMGKGGAIDPAGDRDFYKFTGTAGQTVAINISANTMDNPMLVDTVIQLYDASMTQIAENDDAIPRINTDSEIIIKLPSSGDFYIEVMEYSDWAMMPPLKGMPSFVYTLKVKSVVAGTGVTIEPATDPGNTAASAITSSAPGTNAFGILVGQFANATDVDVFQINVPAGKVAMLAAVMPGGAAGYGSTATPAPAELRDAAGATVIARQPANASGMNPPLTSGNYLLYVSRTAGMGANDFWVAKFITNMTDNPAETETVPGQNDTNATAQALTMMVNGGTHQGFILSHLTTMADVDEFSFTVPAGGAMVTAFCGSRSNGSGVTGLHGELRDSANAVVAGTSVNEDAAMGLSIAPMAMTPAGTYYLRLSKTGQDATVTGDWVRCGVRTTP